METSKKLGVRAPGLAELEPAPQLLGPGAVRGGGEGRARAAGGCGAMLPVRQGLGTGPLDSGRLGARRPRRRRRGHAYGPAGAAGSAAPETRFYRRATQPESNDGDSTPTRGSAGLSVWLTRPSRSRPRGAPSAFSSSPHTAVALLPASGWGRGLPAASGPGTWAWAACLARALH